MKGGRNMVQTKETTHGGKKQGTFNEQEECVVSRAQTN